jgi:hypothetical protein
VAYYFKKAAKGSAMDLGSNHLYQHQWLVTPAPTTAEVEQAGATDMDNKGIKRRRRGRSMTILTGSAGVQEGATLGTPTLLG